MPTTRTNGAEPESPGDRPGDVAGPAPTDSTDPAPREPRRGVDPERTDPPDRGSRGRASPRIDPVAGAR